MKNFKHIISITVLTVILFSSTSANAQWWKKALADAGGALGGAGSVASISSVFSLTPPGLVALGGGAVVGGAAASVVVSGSDSSAQAAEAFQAGEQATKGGRSSGQYRNASKSTSSGNSIGELHNQAIIEYFDNYTTFNKDTFYTFLTSNPKYGLNDEIKFSKNDYNAIVQESIHLRSPGSTKLIEFILKHIPPTVDNQRFRDYLILLLNSTASLSEFKAQIDTIEELTKTENDMTKLDSLIMDSFFSTLRHSSDFWH